MRGGRVLRSRLELTCQPAGSSASVRLAVLFGASPPQLDSVRTQLADCAEDVCREVLGPKYLRKLWRAVEVATLPSGRPPVQEPTRAECGQPSSGSSDELVTAAVADEGNPIRHCPDFSTDVVEGCRFRFGHPEVPGEHCAVDETGQRAVVPDGDLLYRAVAQNSEPQPR